jgi:group I intron endonuclease
MKRHTIYLHVNAVNGKGYVGNTSYDMMKRWRRHVSDAKRGSSLCFHQAIIKNGEDSFEHYVLINGLCEQDSRLAEFYYVMLLGTKYPRGYNRTEGGAGCTGLRWSEESIARNSAAQKEAQNRPDVRERKIVAAKDAHARPEVKAKHSAATLKACSRPEVRERMRLASRKRWSNQEERDRHSISSKESQNRPEVKAKRSAAIREALSRPDVKAKKSAAQKEVWARKRATERLESKSAEQT